MTGIESNLKCPNCSMKISFATRQCAGCGFLYSEQAYQKMFFYFDINNEMKNIIAIESSYGERLAKLSQKLLKFEEILNADGGLKGVKPEGKSQLDDVAAPGEKPCLAAAPSPASEKSAPEVLEMLKTENAQPRGGKNAGEKRDKKSAFDSKDNLSEIRAMKNIERFENPDAAVNANRDESDFEAMLGQKWMLIIGIITIVFGVGFFLKYSFEKELIGPAGQIALAYLLGVTFLGLGNVFHKKGGFENFGFYITGGGIAVFYFAAFASFQLYNPPVVGQEISFAIMIMVTALACALAVIYDTQWLAVLGLIGGFLTPVLLSTGTDNALGLFSYMTLLNAGILFVAFKKNWNLLNNLGFSATYFLFSAWYANHYYHNAAKFWTAFIFLNVFYLIYAVAPFAYQFLSSKYRQTSGFTIITLNSFIALAYSYNMISGYMGSTYFVSLVSVFYAAVFLSMASYLFRQGKQYADSFVIILAEALIFLIITVPLIFSGHWITFFWAAQAFAIFFMAARLDKEKLFTVSYILFAITIFKLLFYDYIISGNFSYYVDNLRIYPHYTFRIVERYIAIIGTLGFLFASGFWSQKNGLSDYGYIYSVFGATLFVVMNAEVPAFFYDYLPGARDASISGLWAIFAAGLMAIGFKFQKYGVRKTAMALFLITLIKVFMYDMAELSTPYRILSFMLLGLILIGVSFFYHKLKDKLGNDSGNYGRR